MHSVARISFIIALPVVVLIAILNILVAPVWGDITCPIPGTRPATASDAVVQNKQIPLGTCYNPNDIGINETAEQAKQYLRSIFHSPTNTCSKLTVEADKIEQLNPAFAVCAAKFLQAVRQVDPSIFITSAYRTAEQQQCMCGSGSSGCAAPGQSHHQQGTAVDLSGNSCTEKDCSWLHAQIERFPGLRHLTLANDPYHMEAVRGGPCMTPGYQPPDFTATPATPATPFTSLADTIRNFISPPPPPPPVSSPPPMTPAPTSGSFPTNTGNPESICTPHFTCSGAVMYYQTSSCTTQAYQLCENGCAGNICALESSQQPTSPVSSLITYTQTKATSTIDLINVFANTKPSSTTGTGTPLILIVRGQDAAILQANQQAQASSTELSNVYQLAPTSQQTFVSTDLSQSPASQYQPQQISTFQITLANLRNVLLRALEYLRPFGGTTHEQTLPNSESVE